MMLRKTQKNVQSKQIERIPGIEEYVGYVGYLFIGLGRESL
jgi:hypothetical protein